MYEIETHCTVGHDSGSFFADKIFADSDKNVKSAKIFYRFYREIDPLYGNRNTLRNSSTSDHVGFGVFLECS